MRQVQAAITGARVTPDARGLMALSEARTRIAGLAVYRKGDGVMVDGTFVLESDLAWAALLSLEDGDEFVREATRIRFEFHVRGQDNTAAVERYGAAVLPWIAANVDAGGVLRNVPWCLLPCLLAIDGEEALSLALSIRGVSSDERVGPGAYAADQQGDVDRAGPLATQDASVARAWAVRDGRMSLLARRAERDPQARALLDALRPPLPSEVAELLEAAPRLEVPHGPTVELGALDEDAQGYQFPIWDNANYTTGAMRVTGLVSSAGDALVIETLTHWPAAGEGIVRVVRAYGPGAGRARSALELVPSAALGAYLDDGSTWLCRVTGVMRFNETRDGDWREIVVTPPAGIQETVQLPVEGVPVSVWASLPEIPDLDEDRKELARALDPEDVALFQLAEPATRERLFLSPDALRAAVEAPADACVLFSFDEWGHPRAGELPSSSIDWVTMVAALGARARIDRLPGQPNTRFHHWLESLAEFRGDPAMWGTGDPLVDDPPPGGVALFSHHETMLRRGWPHLVTLVHDHPCNQRSLATKTAEKILRDDPAMFRVTWPREVAFRVARALGASREGADPEIQSVAAALEASGPLSSTEAMDGLRVAFSRQGSVAPSLAADHVLLLEASVGPEVVIDGALAALADVMDGRDESAVRALDALGYVLLRAPNEHAVRARGALAALAPRWGDAALGSLARLLSGERPAVVPDAWLGHVTEDPAFVCARAAASTEPMTIDARVVIVGGSEVLEGWRARLDSLASPSPWDVVQLGMLADPRAAELLRAFVDRGWCADDARTWLGYR
jgi:hypothetical protein